MFDRLTKNIFQSRKKETGVEKIQEILDFVENNDLYPDIRELNSAVEPETTVDGKRILMFASNNYLGLATNNEVKKAAISAIEKYGVGATGSRLLTGNIDIHLELEKELAKFKKAESAIVFPTGFAANMGTIAGIMNPLKVSLSFYFGQKGVILSDALNHASIVDGIKLSGQEKFIYKHCDMEHLEFLLKKYANRRKLIVTDSVFSMDGDVAPLDKISLLARKYNAMTMIDEAHAVGVLGKTGGGAMEYFNLKPSIDITIVMGTLSKAIGCTGGYVVGSKELIKYLRIAARSYMFSTAMSPAISAAALASINIIKTDQSLKDKLWTNIEYLKLGFNNLGLQTMKTDSAIVPVLIGKEETAIEISRALYSKNIYAPCVRWPVVPRGESRIRLTVTSSHTFEQLDTLLSAFREIGSKFNLIQ